MKRLLTATAVLMCLTAAAPVFALDAPRDGSTDRRERTTVIDDVIRMSQAGVSDEAIIKFVHESRDRYVVDADVVIALTDAHVSKAVINSVMDEAYGRDDDQNGVRRDDRRRTTTTVYVRPSYDPWYYGYAYDPFWYGPRLSFGFGFGYGGYRGGHYSGGGGHYGGGGHGGGHGRH
jgi:hypothetical protein